MRLDSGYPVRDYRSDGIWASALNPLSLRLLSLAGFNTRLLSLRDD